MNRAEILIRRAIGFLQSAPGKATIGLFTGVICFTFPLVPAYTAGACALYYCVHEFREVAGWIYRDIQADLQEEPIAGE
jgi:hypothetical protein